MADRIVVMNEGRIEQIGAPLELYDNPRSVFVAQFIGSPSMNLLKGKVETQNGGAVFRIAENATLPLPADSTISLENATAYGVRPEYLGVVEAGQGFAAKVVVVEPLGSEIQLILSVGDQTLVAVIRERINIQPDDVIWLAPQVDRVCLFDANGNRLGV